MINLGAAFYYLGDYSKAGMFLREALKMAPNDRTLSLGSPKRI